MDIHWTFGARFFPHAAAFGKGFAGVMAIAALAGIYPVAAALASAMATSLRVDMPKPAAGLVVVSAGAAERNSLGLRSVTFNPIREE